MAFSDFSTWFTDSLNTFSEYTVIEPFRDQALSRCDLLSKATLTLESAFSLDVVWLNAWHSLYKCLIYLMVNSTSICRNAVVADLRIESHCLQYLLHSEFSFVRLEIITSWTVSLNHIADRKYTVYFKFILRSDQSIVYIDYTRFNTNVYKLKHLNLYNLSCSKINLTVGLLKYIHILGWFKRVLRRSYRALICVSFLFGILFISPDVTTYCFKMIIQMSALKCQKPLFRKLVRATK